MGHNVLRVGDSMCVWLGRWFGCLLTAPRQGDALVRQDGRLEPLCDGTALGLVGFCRYAIRNCRSRGIGRWQRKVAAGDREWSLRRVARHLALESFT
jgi:hypothetical protein